MPLKHNNIFLFIVSACFLFFSIEPAMGSTVPFDAYPRYNLKIKVDTKNHYLEAVETVNFTNNTGVSLDELHFNIYANKQFTREETKRLGFYQNYFKVNMFPDGPKGADFKINSVTTSNRPLNFVIEGPSLTAMKVALPGILRPGKRIDLQIKFTLKLPHAFGILGYFQGVNYLGHWYPILSVYKGGKWHDNPLGVNHQPYFSDAAYYETELTIENEQVVAHSGELVHTERNSDGTKTLKVKTGPVRDFTFDTSSEYKILSSQVKGIQLNVYCFPVDIACAQKALEYAVSAMEFYTEKFGTYPYSVFNIVETHIGWLGNEFSNMIFIYSRGFNLPDILYRHLDFLISHEMAHQWWYLQVGSDQFSQTWLDEAFASYANTLYLESKYGKDNNYLALPKWALFLPNTSFREARVQRYLYAAKNKTDETILIPINEFRRPENVFILPYDKGMWILDMLRYITGEETFQKIMDAYLSNFRYKTADTEDFIRICENVSGKNLKWFFNQWLTTTGKCDYALDKIRQHNEPDGWVTSFNVVRKGEIKMPVEILAVTKSGRKIWRKWHGRGASYNFRITTEDRIVKILIDPKKKLLDYKLQNNYWPIRKKIKLTPYYPLLYDIPLLNPSDAYSVVAGATYNVFNAGLRITGRRVYDYTSYIDSRYNFSHRRISTVLGHQIEHSFGSLISLDFEGGYDRTMDNAKRFNKGTDSLVKGRVALTKQLGPTFYSIDKVLNNVTFYFERNREVYLENQKFNRSKFGITYNLDHRVLAWDPIKGIKLKCNLEEGGMILGSNTDFTKFEIDTSLYNQLWKQDYIFANRMNVGLSWGDVVGAERYMLGGKDTLRGYGDEKFASKNKFLFNSEYRFPIIRDREDSLLRDFITFNRLNGVVFYEAGMPWDDEVDFNSDNVKTDVGFGLRFEVTVLGFFEKTLNRIDVGLPLDGDGKLQPHIWFEITHAF